MTSLVTGDRNSQILVAGIGNIFLGDDGFGSEVARRLLRLDWPAEVNVVDYGIRGVDLTYALLDGYAGVILIDAIPGDHPPGTIRVLEPDVDDLPKDTSATLLDAHTMHPLAVLQLVKTMGGQLRQLRVVGCQPDDFGGEDGRIGLSPVVQAAVDEVIPLVHRLVAELRAQIPAPVT